MTVSASHHLPYRNNPLWAAIQACPWVPPESTAWETKPGKKKRREPQPLIDLVEKALDSGWPLEAVDACLDEYFGTCEDEQRKSAASDDEYPWQKEQEKEYTNPKTWRPETAHRLKRSGRRMKGGGSDDGGGGEGSWAEGCVESSGWEG